MNLDEASLDTPNCPECLHPMEPVVGAWWCFRCLTRIDAAGSIEGPTGPDWADGFDGPLSEGHLIQLGRVAYYAAVIDRLAGDLAAFFIDNGPLGQVVVAGLNFSDLLDLIARLAKARSEEDATLVSSLFPELRAAMDKRNMLLHGYWDHAPADPHPSVSLRRRKPMLQVGMSAGEVQKAADDLHTAANSLYFTLLQLSGEMDGYING